MQIKSFRSLEKRRQFFIVQSGRVAGNIHIFFGGPKGKMCWLYLKCQIPRSHMEGANMCFNNQVNEQTYEPRREKTGFLHMGKQRRRLVTAKLISAFVFATWIVLSLYFPNLKFQASSNLL